jgi:hypothetical protein
LVEHGLVGRCGLYCGACSIYRGYKDQGEFLSELSAKLNVPKEKIRCEGCSALTPDCWGTGCKIVECLNGKGYEFCDQCELFKEKSCDKYENVASRYLKRGEDIRVEIGRIRKMGFKAWLREQDLKWRCEQCQAPVSVHASKCYSCGHPLPNRARS